MKDGCRLEILLTTAVLFVLLTGLLASPYRPVAGLVVAAAALAAILLVGIPMGQDILAAALGWVRRPRLQRQYRIASLMIVVAVLAILMGLVRSPFGLVALIIGVLAVPVVLFTFLMGMVERFLERSGYSPRRITLVAVSVTCLLGIGLGLLMGALARR